jgi:hypothetical protein
MGKIIRLTEQDLVRLVNRVIKEEINTMSPKINYSVIGKFLRSINQGGTQYTSKWVLDSGNPMKRGMSAVKLTGKEETIPMNYVGKPLVWSLVVNGKKVPNAIFEIFSSNGKLAYQCSSPLKGGIQNSDGYKELEPNLNSAIEQFNQRVSF